MSVDRRRLVRAMGGSDVAGIMRYHGYRVTRARVLALLREFSGRAGLTNAELRALMGRRYGEECEPAGASMWKHLTELVRDGEAEVVKNGVWRAVVR